MLLFGLDAFVFYRMTCFSFGSGLMNHIQILYGAVAGTVSISSLSSLLISSNLLIQNSDKYAIRREVCNTK